MGLWFGPRAASLRLAGRTNASVSTESVSKLSWTGETPVPTHPHLPRIPSIIGACLKNLVALFNMRGRL
jgi:hypothetical protein